MTNRMRIMKSNLGVESDPLKLSATKLYGTIHKLVPNPCLFTIIEPPTTDDPPVSSCGASVEQLNQQTQL